jgi:hypothetical protein
MNHAHREQVKAQWDQAIKPRRQRSAQEQAYLDLRELRNVLAHGSRSNFAEIQEALASQASLTSALQRAIELAHEGVRR